MVNKVLNDYYTLLTIFANHYHIHSPRSESPVAHLFGTPGVGIPTTAWASSYLGDTSPGGDGLPLLGSSTGVGSS